MLLNLIDNLPRLRMSSSLLKLIIWLLKQCGVCDVPSYDALRKFQTKLQKSCGAEPETHISSLGNVFTVNNPAASVQLVSSICINCMSLSQHNVFQDLANPEVAKHIQLYPEVVENGPISEVWQATRWKEFQRSELNPMYASGLKHFYVNELAQLDNGQLVIPDMWFTWRHGASCDVYAECYDVFSTEVSPSLFLMPNISLTDPSWAYMLQGRKRDGCRLQHFR